MHEPGGSTLVAGERRVLGECCSCGLDAGVEFGAGLVAAAARRPGVDEHVERRVQQAADAVVAPAGLQHGDAPAVHETVEPSLDGGLGVREQSNDERAEDAIDVRDGWAPGVTPDEMDVLPAGALDAGFGARQHPGREVDADDGACGADPVAEVFEVRARAATEVDRRVAGGQRERVGRGAAEAVDAGQHPNEPVVGARPPPVERLRVGDSHDFGFGCRHHNSRGAAGTATRMSKSDDTEPGCMDRVRVAYDFLRAYVYALVIGAVVTVLWLASPQIADAAEVASIWFAIGFFGVLVLVTFLLTQYAREF